MDNNIEIGTELVYYVNKFKRGGDITYDNFSLEKTELSNCRVKIRVVEDNIKINDYAVTNRYFDTLYFGFIFEDDKAVLDGIENTPQLYNNQFEHGADNSVKRKEGRTIRFEIIKEYKVI